MIIEDYIMVLRFKSFYLCPYSIFLKVKQTVTCIDSYRSLAASKVTTTYCQEKALFGMAQRGQGTESVSEVEGAMSVLTSRVHCGEQLGKTSAITSTVQKGKLSQSTHCLRSPWSTGQN